VRGWGERGICFDGLRLCYFTAILSVGEKVCFSFARDVHITTGPIGYLVSVIDTAISSSDEVCFSLT
jgi:hypothetical protein